MNTIVNKNTSKVNYVRGTMLIHGTTLAEWATANGFSKQLVHSVLYGRIGKLRSPVTKAGQIESALKRDGYWPPEEQI